MNYGFLRNDSMSYEEILKLLLEFLKMKKLHRAFYYGHYRYNVSFLHGVLANLLCPIQRYALLERKLVECIEIAMMV